MKIPLSERPGRHERHFIRKLDNDLFPRPLRNVDDDDLLEVQRLDHEEILAFLSALRGLVQKAAQLKPNEDSEVVLDLKADLENLYETACRLADQQGNNKAVIRELLDVIMKTVRAHAAGDPKAESELEQEMQARTQHFALLENSLIADLIDPETLIREDELTAVLLTVSLDELSSVLGLFDEGQLLLLRTEAENLLREKGRLDDADMQQRLELLESFVTSS